jgi:hypothetical protein
MKTNAFLFSFILLGGCHARTPPPVSPADVTAPVAQTPSPLPSQLRAPEVVKTYTIGAYVDPADPTLRHEAHTVQRIEAAAYWDLRPVIELKSQAPVPVAETAKPAGPQLPSPVLPTAVAIPPPVELTADPEPALMPNADGMIDLTSLEAPAADEVNPFAVRTASTNPPRTIELRITGILAGVKPGAIINGQLLEPGAIVEGLILKRIEPSAVILTLGRHRLRVPLSSEPIRVRTTP